MKLMPTLVLLWLLFLPLATRAETTTVAREREIPTGVSICKNDCPLGMDVTQFDCPEQLQPVTGDLFCQLMGVDYRFNWNRTITLKSGNRLSMSFDLLFRDGEVVAEQGYIVLPSRLSLAEQYVDAIQTWATSNFGKATTTTVNQLKTPDWYRRVELTNDVGDQMVILWQGATLLIMLRAGPAHPGPEPPGLLLLK